MEPQQQQSFVNNAWWIGKQYKISLTPSKNTQTSLIITDTHILIGEKNSKSPLKLDLKDLIGVKFRTLPKQEGSQFSIVGFPLIKKFMRARARYVQTMAKVWICTGSKQELTKQSQAVYEALKHSIANNVDNTPLKLLIYFNPISGSNSKKHMEAVVDFLEHTNFEYDLLTTKHKDHCMQHAKTIRKQEYRAVVIVSGDGLLHQFLNAQVDIPVTHVPGGSGNGFAKTQTYLAGQDCRDQEAIYLVIKNRKKQFNITKYELENLERPIYSFLHFQWCILADLDMNSQFLRFLGGLRFDLYGAWRIVNMKRYRGKLYYSQTCTQLPPLSEDLSSNPNFKTVDDTFLHLMMINLPYISDKYKFGPKVKIQQEKMDQHFILASHGRIQLAKYLLSADSGTHFDEKQDKVAQGMTWDYSNIKSFRLQPLGPLEEQGVFGIDGEKYDAQCIQGSIYQKKLISFV